MDTFGQMEMPKNMSEELVLKQKKRNRLLIISSIAIVVLIIVIILVVSLSKKSNEEKNVDNNKEQNSKNSENSENSDNSDDSKNTESDDDDFTEKEQPELNEETKALISKYQRESTLENYINLRDAVIKNYNAVLVRKEGKLSELKKETEGKPGGEEKVAEMEDIVQDMYITYWNRINSNMLRFTDNRLLKWVVSKASEYEYIPVMGAGETIYIKRTPVTNSEYAEFIKEKKYKAPSNWENKQYLTGEDDYPVNYVSYNDAINYCNWLTSKDGVNTYRLPSESEWELAAGHMPKDADFNNNVIDGRVSVYKYDGITRGAHGAIDFWGNVWEWTSTIRSTINNINMLAVKGGSWKSDRTDCRTEHRKESRNDNECFDDVGFRVIQVLNGKESEQKVELYTLDPPVLSAKFVSTDTILLSWEPVEGAVEYQIFGYSEDTELFSMIDRTKETSYTINYSEENKNCKYVVQSLSYTEISDNVSSEYAVKPLS